MSDQEGKIIDLPIQANFREGLSSIDYIISSYGARKGIVDTALKTADSGYLTRRLIYIAQDLVIREKDCKTEEGVIVLLNKKTNTSNLVGRTLLTAKSTFYPYEQLDLKNNILTSKKLKELKKLSSLSLNVCSTLTCKSNGSICQKCYGWDLAHQKVISLGEAVGIIAAQSIGEPGTQLTMRTFHTGGIFTGETLKQIKSPFSGKLIIPLNLKSISYRTNHGIIVLKLQQEVNLTLINWKGIEKNIFLEIGSFLYISKSTFIKKGELISEYATQSIIQGSRRLKPIYTSLCGEIRFENLLVRKMLHDKRMVKVNQDNGVLWIASGKIFPLPKEINYTFPEKIKLNRSFSFLKLITPYQGVIHFDENKLSIVSLQKQFSFNFANLIKIIENCTIKFSLIVKNYQYVDKYSILGFLTIFPKYEGKIYALKKKDSKYIRTLFMVTDSDVWKINSDQLNDFSFFQDKKIIVRAGSLLNQSDKFSNSGFFLKKDGFKMVFQRAMPIFLTRGTILNYEQGDFVFEKKIFATLVNYTQQTEDIVQGLPKIEELIEARKPQTKSYLATRPGIFMNSLFLSDAKKVDTEIKRIIKKDIIKCICPPKLTNTSLFLKNGKKQEEKESKKQFVYMIQSLFLRENLILFNNRIFKKILIPTSLSQPLWKKADEFVFEDLYFNGKKMNKQRWEKKQSRSVFPLYQYKNKEWKEWINVSEFFMLRKKDDIIIKTNEGKFIYLEYLNPIFQTKLPLISKPLFDSGKFIDIGEPITEGTIDVHELLKILFKYHATLDGIMEGTNRSLTKFQLILVNSIQSIYQSQGVNISSKHIEIIVRQMTAKVVIKESGDTPLLPGELIRISLVRELYKSLRESETSLNYKTPSYEPILLSTTNSSLSKDGFLSAAGFQETKRVLTKAAIEGTSDWLRGLKECIIIGRLIPAGSSFLNYKNYLDNVYLFKN